MNKYKRFTIRIGYDMVEDIKNAFKGRKYKGSHIIYFKSLKDLEDSIKDGSIEHLLLKRKGEL